MEFLRALWRALQDKLPWWLLVVLSAVLFTPAWFIGRFALIQAYGWGPWPMPWTQHLSVIACVGLSAGTVVRYFGVYGFRIVVGLLVTAVLFMVALILL